MMLVMKTDGNYHQPKLSSRVKQNLAKMSVY